MDAVVAWEYLANVYARYESQCENPFDMLITYKHMKSGLREYYMLTKISETLSIILAGYDPLINMIREYLGVQLDIYNSMLHYIKSEEYRNNPSNAKTSMDITLEVYSKIKMYEVLRETTLETKCGIYICTKCNRDPRSNNDCIRCKRKRDCKWIFSFAGSKCSCGSFMYKWNMNGFSQKQWLERGDKLLGELFAY